MEYQKIDDRIFAIYSRNSWFLLNTYPFQIFRIKNASNIEDIRKAYHDLKQTNMLSYSEDYSFKGFMAMEWIMTSECNLNCPHCFAHVRGEIGRFGLGNNAISREDLRAGIDKSVKLFQKNILDNGLTSAEYQLFIIGGEPLIEFNTLKWGIEYLEEKLNTLEQKTMSLKIERGYFLATNGLLINNEIAEFLNDYPFTVSVSIDTPINPIKLDDNLSRKTEVAIDGAKKLIQAGMHNIILNCVIPAEKVYELDHIMEYIEGFGIMDKISGVQISPLTPPTRQTKYSGCNANQIVISKWSEDLDQCKYFASKLIEYCEKYHTDMKKYHRRVKHMVSQGGVAYRCPTAQWKWSLVPGGKIYPCHQFIGIPKYVMGDVHHPDEIFYTEIKKMESLFKERIVFKVKPCDECPLQSCCCVFIDCPGRALLEGGDMYNVPAHQCLMAKDYLLKILEEVLWDEL